MSGGTLLEGGEEEAMSAVKVMEAEAAVELLISLLIILREHSED